MDFGTGFGRQPDRFESRGLCSANIVRKTVADHDGMACGNAETGERRIERGGVRLAKAPVAADHHGIDQIAEARQREFAALQVRQSVRDDRSAQTPLSEGAEDVRCTFSRFLERTPCNDELLREPRRCLSPPSA